MREERVGVEDPASGRGENGRAGALKTVVRRQTSIRGGIQRQPGVEGVRLQAYRGIHHIWALVLLSNGPAWTVTQRAEAETRGR